MPYLFEKYSIDSVQFSQSDLYYASLPLEYEDIYKTIQSRLENEVKAIDDARNQKTKSARERSKKVRDSLKQLSSDVKPQILSEKENNNPE